MSASSHASGSFSTLSTLPCEFKGLLGKGPLTLALSPNRGRGKSRKLKDSPPERELWRGEQVAQEDRGRDQADQCGDENCGSNQLGTQAILLGQDEVEDRRRHRGIQENNRPVQTAHVEDLHKEQSQQKSSSNSQSACYDRQ